MQRQLSVINPKIITLLGNVAAYGVLQEKVAVRKDHGKIIEKDGKKYFITLHPAAGLRFPSLKKLLLEDFKKLTHYYSYYLFIIFPLAIILICVV